MNKDYKSMTNEELISLIESDTTNKSQTKAIIKTINERTGLVGSVVLLYCDTRLLYIEEIEGSVIIGKTLSANDQLKECDDSQTNKREFYWISSYGQKKKSYASSCISIFKKSHIKKCIGYGKDITPNDTNNYL